MLKRIILPIAFIVFTQVLLAQSTIKQGKIFYEMNFPDLTLEQKQMMAGMLPKDATAYFKEGKTRVETPMPFGKLVIIRNNADKEFIFAFNNVEKKKKVAFKKTDEEVKSALADSTKAMIKVELTKETKMIAGYKGTKAIVKAIIKNDTIESEYWFCSEIPKINMGNEQDEIFSKLNGGILEYTVNQAGMRVSMKIRQLVIETISDNLFELGANYKIVKNEVELAEEMLK
jgi:hypothetical protein